MEDVLIPVVVFSSLLLFLKMMLDYGRFKHQHRAGTRSVSEGASNSLRVSELEALVRDAVDDAVRPLERRIRRLERASRRDDSSRGAGLSEQEGVEVSESNLDAPRRLLSERPVEDMLDDDFDRDIDREQDFEDEFRAHERRVRQPRVRRS